MAKTIRAKNEYQQNIVKMLNSLAGRYSRWTVWQDFITMAAVAKLENDELRLKYYSAAVKLADAIKTAAMNNGRNE